MILLDADIFIHIYKNLDKKDKFILNNSCKTLNSICELELFNRHDLVDIMLYNTNELPIYFMSFPCDVRDVIFEFLFDNFVSNFEIIKNLMYCLCTVDPKLLTKIVTSDDKYIIDILSTVDLCELSIQKILKGCMYNSYDKFNLIILSYYTDPDFDEISFVISMMYEHCMTEFVDKRFLYGFIDKYINDLSNTEFGFFINYILMFDESMSFMWLLRQIKLHNIDISYFNNNTIQIFMITRGSIKCLHSCIEEYPELFNMSKQDIINKINKQILLKKFASLENINTNYAIIIEQ